MKIAEVSPYSMSVPGGVQGQVLALARSMRNLGHDVDVIAPCDEQTMVEEVLSLGGSHNWWANGSIAPIALGPKMWFGLRSILRSNGYDIVHLHEPLTPFVGVATLMFSPVPTVGTFHRSGASLTYRAYGRSLGRLARRLSLRFAVSEEARRTARLVSGVDSIVSRNGVDLSRFSGVPPWQKDGFVVMFIGRHEPRKGLEVLLEAFSLLEDPDVELWVAGDGPESLKLHSKFRQDSRVRWLGRVSEAEASARMLAADIVVAPSLFGESFGVVLLEAMACSSAVVASDIDGYRGLVENGVDGFLVPPGNPSALKGAIVELMESPDTLRFLASNGLKKAEKHSMDTLAKTYLDLFTEQLSH